VLPFSWLAYVAAMHTEAADDPDRVPRWGRALPALDDPDRASRGQDDPDRATSPALADLDCAPRFGRALLALTAAATVAAGPIAAAAIGPADSSRSAHSIPVYLISRLSHDVGHNDWAFQGRSADRIAWVVTYVALALFWLGVAIWIRLRTRPEPRLWLRVLVAAWATELVAALLTLGAGAFAAWTSTPIGADVLHGADLCSPWWSCVAAVLVVARAERSTLALRAIAAYAAVLALVLLVPLPGPDAVKALLLALPAAIPALMTPLSRESALTFG
jgi:hypothetical protein